MLNARIITKLFELEKIDDGSNLMAIVKMSRYSAETLRILISLERESYNVSSIYSSELDKLTEEDLDREYQKIISKE